MDVLLFLISFIVILAGCEFFTNAVEWLGKRYNLAEGAIGSVLAAVGTALPETLVPLIAIIFVGGQAGEEIGAGAILGAPFMLATLAMFVCGLSVYLFAKKRGRKTLAINGTLIRRDLKFFLIAYSLAAVAALLPTSMIWFKYIVAFLLFPLYIYYSYITIRTGEASCAESDLKCLYMDKYVCRIKNGLASVQPEDDVIGEKLRKAIYPGEPATYLIFAQLFMGLAGIIVGATIFVGQINAIAEAIGMNPTILALVVAPIATELPEKFNSFIWIREGKDTYAIGNITGAMVFQSCIPVTIGIALTTWHLDLTNSVDALMAVSIGIALLTGSVLYLRSTHKELHTSGLMMGGVMYLIFLMLVVWTVG